jgi:potassium large conductance calcium-activated channel subfamily M alpha protein 1
LVFFLFVVVVVGVGAELVCLGVCVRLLKVERLLRPIKDRVIVELQEETEIQYLRPRVTFDRRMFDTEMYRRNRVATFQFAPPYMDGKAFCPSTLNFLM